MALPVAAAVPLLVFRLVEPVLIVDSFPLLASEKLLFIAGLWLWFDVKSMSPSERYGRSGWFFGGSAGRLRSKCARVDILAHERHDHVLPAADAMRVSVSEHDTAL